MRRVVCLMVFFLILFCSVALCESTRTDDSVVFSVAIEELKHINSKDNVEEAQKILSGITSNYNQANMFRIYAEAIIDVYNGDFDDSQTKLDVLSLSKEFVEMLLEYGLQSCEDIQHYISARRLESEGKLSEAFEIYTSVNFLDSLERSITIAQKRKEMDYQKAMSLFSEGKYSDAAQAFDKLGQYRNSEAMATAAREQVQSEPEPASDDYKLNIPWKAIDWTSSISEYMYIMIGDTILLPDHVDDLLRWLSDQYGISAIASQVDAAGISLPLFTVLDIETPPVGILVYGFDWLSLSDLVTSCDEKGIPIWISKKTDLNECMQEIEGLFDGVYSMNRTD